MHIAQGVFKAMNVNKCTAAGGTFIFWVADWFALMNDKMGGDLAKVLARRGPLSLSLSLSLAADPPFVALILKVNPI